MSDICVDQLREAYQFLGDKEARRIVDLFSELHAQREDLSISFQDARRAAIEDNNFRALKDVADQWSDLSAQMYAMEHVAQRGFQGDPIEGMLSIFEGTTRKVRNNANTIENTVNANIANLGNWFFNEVNRKGLRPLFNNEAKLREVGSQIFDRGLEGFTPTKDPAVRELSDLISRVNARQMQMLQDAGSTITPNPQYVFRQTHNSDRILQNTRQWVGDVIDRLDWEKTFGPNTSRKQAFKFLSDLAEEMDTTAWGDGSIFLGKREFHFKSFDDFWEYNKVYGYHDMAEGLIIGIEKTSRSAAIQRYMGANPVENLKELKGHFARVYGSKKVQRWDKVEDAMAYAMGLGNRPGYGVGQKIFNFVSGFKAYQVMDKLGMSALTTAYDLVNTTALLRNLRGESFPTSVAKSNVRWLTNLPMTKKQKNEIAEMFDVALTDSMADLIDTKDLDLPGMPGMLSKMASISMNLNLNMPATRHNRRVIISLVGQDLKRNILTPTENLNRFQKHTRDSLGLTSRDVNILQTALNMQGREIPHIGPGVLRNIDRTKLPGTEIQIRDLETRLGAYFNEQMTSGSPLPGAKENRIMQRHRPQDDPVRIAAEAIFQFKGSVMRSMRSQMKAVRAAGMEGDLVNANSTMMLGQLVILGTVVHYTQQALRDFIRGRETKFPETPAEIPRFVAQGTTSAATFGVIGDALLGQHWNYNRSAVESVAGPIISEIMGQRGYLDMINKLSQDPSFDRLESSGQQLLRKSMPNHFLIEALQGHILEETNERLR